MIGGVTGCPMSGIDDVTGKDGVGMVVTVVDDKECDDLVEG